MKTGGEMSVLGLATTEEVDAKVKKLEQALREMEQRLSQKLRGVAPQTVSLSDASITVDDLLNRLVVLVKPLLKDCIKEAFAELDMNSLGDRLFEEINMDDFMEKLASSVAARMLGSIDKEELMGTIARVIVEDHWDLDTLADNLVENLSGKLEIKVSKD